MANPWQPPESAAAESIAQFYCLGRLCSEAVHERSDIATLTTGSYNHRPACRGMYAGLNKLSNSPLNQQDPHRL